MAQVEGSGTAETERTVTSLPSLMGALPLGPEPPRLKLVNPRLTLYRPLFPEN
jgi:hypothetical protein